MIYHHCFQAYATITICHEHKIKKLEVEWANARANSAILEAQLKKKMENEHALASQVSNLALRLAESAAESGTTATAYAVCIRSLEEERNVLRFTINQLSLKLQKVAEVLDDMTLAQDAIVQQAAVHEDRMTHASLEHASIIASARQQEEMFENARRERAQMALLLQKQEEQVQQSIQERKIIIDTIEKHSAHMELTHADRHILVTNARLMRNEMKNILETELAGILTRGDDGQDIDLVDAMVKQCTSDARDQRIKSTGIKQEAKEGSQNMHPELAATVSTITSASLAAQLTEERELESRFLDSSPALSQDPEGSKMRSDGRKDRSALTNEADVEEKKMENEMIQTVVPSASNVLARHDFSSEMSRLTTTSGSLKAHQSSFTELQIASRVNSSAGWDHIEEARSEGVTPTAYSITDRIEAARAF